MPDGADILEVYDELDRRAAQKSFLRFYQRMTGFEAPRHLRVLSKLLQSMEEDKVDRAMIFMPPRHGKTLLCSKLFPAWIMGRHPRSPVMMISHTDDLAQEIGGDIRRYVMMPEWPWPEVTLSGDTTAKGRWRTNYGGAVNSFSITAGNQHGRPAEWLFMDDIVKGYEVANSADQLKKIWQKYLTDLRSRLQQRRKQLLIFTRWSEADPAGMILPEGFDGRTGWYADRETGERWYVLSLPAVSEHENDPCGRKPGEWLWPEEWGEETLGFERKRGGRNWASLYQQRPAPQEGLLFHPEHIQRYDMGRLPLGEMTIYISSDYAVTEEAGATDPDYTVHMVWGVDSVWNLYLLDMWRGRTTSDVWVDQWLRLVRQWNPLQAVEEGGQIIKSIGPFISQRMREEGVFVHRVPINSSSASGGKEQRAHALLGMAQMGRLLLPKRHEVAPHVLPHIEAFEKELLQFPAGRHDDTVDAATLFGRHIGRVIQGRRIQRSRGHVSSPQGPTMQDVLDLHMDELDREDREW